MSRATGGDAGPEDSELAGLLGVLGLDAYTHDQLVAKDEGEEASFFVFPSFRVLFSCHFLFDNRWCRQEPPRQRRAQA